MSHSLKRAKAKYYQKLKMTPIIKKRLHRTQKDIMKKTKKNK